ncbi:Histone-lysine N-methyltransferase SETMAR [Trichinella papuae]|uniref:Histone-lysine N-methyltransferase SETMAR n=1 Tax=Trichinella papuae TaxID=268474 RepID=A0A0V1M3Y8_9BILA|nr:Histone-lysine N-methyltransferase SETMAR [Trichinella papuae]
MINVGYYSVAILVALYLNSGYGGVMYHEEIYSQARKGGSLPYDDVLPSSKGSKAARDICSVYREGAISERTAQIWFSRLKKGKFDVTDSPRSGRLVQFNEDRLNELMHNDPHQSTRELAQQMGYSNDTCVSCKTVCVGAKPGECKVQASSSPILLLHSTPS